ncbi:MAG TPA: hypothetical protein DHM90_10370 [Clostridiaceae bacterium]|nr:hypothetical protein [Clostridiaceae bacterium]
MDDYGRLIIFSAMGYLIGSVSFARTIFALKRPGEEPARITSVSTDGEAVITTHAVGATSVMMVMGKKWGVLTMVLDLLKAFLPMVALRIIYPEESYHLITGLFVLIGHLWPIFYRFRGGGGNSTVMGMMLAASPPGFLVTQLGGMVFGMISPSLTFIAVVALSIPWFMVTEGVLADETLFAVLMTFFYLLAQYPETRAYLRYKNEGYTFDSKHVVNMMKHASKMKTDKKHDGKRDTL